MQPPVVDSASLIRLVQPGHRSRHASFAPLVESYQVLLWFDAFGLALVSVAGAVKASDVGVLALVAIAMGAVTGVVGGIVRDTLAHVPSVLLGREVYVTASVLGAGTYVSLNGLGVDRAAAMIAGFLVTSPFEAWRSDTAGRCRSFGNRPGANVGGAIPRTPRAIN